MTRRTKIPTIEELQQHAQEIAAAFDVTLLESAELCANVEDAKAARMTDDSRHVLVQPITCQARYAVAMHELGHCIHPLGFISGSDTVEARLTQEHAAWEWAEHYALDWTTAMEQVKLLALETYEANAREQRADARKREQGIKSWLGKIGV